MKDDPYMCPITIDSSNFSREECKQALELCSQAIQSRKSYQDIINKNSPKMGRIKTLAILYYFGRQKIRIPCINSAKRRLRNKQIYKLYKQNLSCTEMSVQFNLTERQVRTIINSMIHHTENVKNPLW